MTVLIAQVTFSSAFAQEDSSSIVVDTQAPEAVNTEAELSECNQPTANGEKVLSSNCRQAATVSETKLTYPQPPHPYDIEAIEKFDAELYGEGN
ncbi:MAG: hypothetical protein F6K36_05820 [Symploca sp. SIO3C6]|uniref:Uncharacterized protein n=1 Tax=Symploca sp. SIO1C4 TaxID=2607765 RepID=A0A6B3NHP0_9CYAN|nr:hypothetical protein [Symploca sp. SIO3C6]NER30062.1 hypothetical protein [Symploca sp. SIO1C4]